MIKAVIFDLDGTLIQTEVLKATSYAAAINELTQNKVAKEHVLDVFYQFVGLSRQEVVSGLAKRYMPQLTHFLDTEDVLSIEEKLIEKRLKVYREILDDTELLSNHFCSFTLGLFHRLYSEEYTLVLATMSHLPEAKKVTQTMGIFDKFNLVLTRDDVEQGKPEPDIYNKAKKILGLKPEECLVIEDSANGVKAAQNANMSVFAVTNDITRKSVHDCNLLEPKFIVDQLEELESRVFGFIESLGTEG
ncbi:HAD family hydrolase [Flagellimonas meridianipacifica]|uniref:HAD superfamily hydrolase (TIGR01509 family)/HAD superfamily hydrolase (TIGR01549 family) n=1 Tax=Flagellimonas meridianipacifica TaxID=1080225 RepID=A0A2T0MIP1_9FLAO|nr:HAD family phosphatase [Allomuricauda pacifica]PRX57452.1 HAD superfamily hydrolase (TIGR01509 family)/HAD superfamily hydrolase (TIGR01549 family) [Allomuricauda pacifica]